MISRALTCSSLFNRELPDSSIDGDKVDGVKVRRELVLTCFEISGAQ